MSEVSSGQVPSWTCPHRQQRAVSPLFPVSRARVWCRGPLGGTSNSCTPSYTNVEEKNHTSILVSKEASSRTLILVMRVFTDGLHTKHCYVQSWASKKVSPPPKMKRKSRALVLTVSALASFVNFVRKNTLHRIQTHVNECILPLSIALILTFK